MKYRLIRPRSIGLSSLRVGPYFTVASVELGNTTTKCVFVATNLKTAEILEIGKEVRMTRDVRPPRDGEEAFGSTVTGKKLTRDSVRDMVSDVILSLGKSTRLDIARDLHFAVRSTGVTAGFARPDEVGEMVKALAEGCLKAGIAPDKMTAAMSPESLPHELQSFTWLKKVYFDGTVASCVPPAGTEIVANEMEGELVTAGIKGAVKGTPIDFRNPVMTLDFGTTLAGRITDDSFPYCRTIGSFAGLAGAIPDAIARGSGIVDSDEGSVLDIPRRWGPAVKSVDTAWVEQAQRLITVRRVPNNAVRFGTVPVNPLAADEAGVTILGVDVGDNGSRLHELSDIGRSFVESENHNALLSLIDHVQTMVVLRLVTLAQSEGLLKKETSLGLTGRAVTTGQKPSLVTEALSSSSIVLSSGTQDLVFVEDGLAMGAAVAARCMNSMGTRENPMGGRKGDKCIMGARMKMQSKKTIREGTRHSPV